jgi:hypothetical protein
MAALVTRPFGRVQAYSRRVRAIDSVCVEDSRDDAQFDRQADEPAERFRRGLERIELGRDRAGQL